ncbi:MFS transporter [Microlunatus sp. GCM10028923]|uniref:MFS transporter n=1 Tax=Microlunatus sp. GCM10028923 TaxID=3273400 RepID=UPI00361C8A37
MTAELTRGASDDHRDDDQGSVAAIKVFYPLSVAAGLTLGLTAPLTAVLAVELGADPFAASASVASLTAVVLLLDLFGTRLLPFLEPRRAITVGMLLWAVGSFGSAVAPSFVIMAAARLVQGVGLALYASAGPQLAIRLTGSHRVGTAIGRFQAAMTLGSAVAPLSGGAVSTLGAGTFGLRLAFAVCGGLAVVCAAVAWFGLPTLRHPKAGGAIRPRWSLPRLPGLARPRPVLALCLGAIGQGARGAVALMAVPLIAAEVLGLGGGWLGIFLTAMYAVEVAAMAFGGGYSDRNGRRTMIIAGTVFGLTGVVVLAVAVHTAAAAVFFAALVPLGLAGGCMLSLLPAVLVDLAGTPEVGLSATRISRDLGFTGCTLAAGAMITVAGAAGALVLIAIMFAVVAAGIMIVGETRSPGPASRSRS